MYIYIYYIILYNRIETIMVTKGDPGSPMILGSAYLTGEAIWRTYPISSNPIHPLSPSHCPPRHVSSRPLPERQRIAATRGGPWLVQNHNWDTVGMKYGDIIWGYLMG
jgi:hypothetical protein